MNGNWNGKRIHFVTGRLAEHSLRHAVERLSEKVSFSYTVDVLKITVAALMTPEWIATRIHVPEGTQIVIVPGYCYGPLDIIEQATDCPVLRGPRDLRRLDAFFTDVEDDHASYGAHNIEVIAEINHAPHMTRKQIMDHAAALDSAGADVIDLGCNPGETWNDVGDTVSALCHAGYRVSIDSMNQKEIGLAVKAGASLVLSVNTSNRESAADWGVEVVVVPDIPSTLQGLDDTIEYLAQRGVPLRIDPVLSPIGFGFAGSLGHYLEIRRRYVDAEMMMGVGNLTELTDVDSVGINVLLLGFCQEVGIRSILTTQVIPWAQTSVRECDYARRLVYHAVHQQVLPKHVEPNLVMLRDADLPEYDDAFFDNLARDLRDHNIRIFSDREGIHLVVAGCHLTDQDPFALFQRYLDGDGGRMDVGHAYYLGYEICKAATAFALGKNYQQDEPLDWGFLTRNEKSHHKIQDRRRAPSDENHKNEQ